MTPRGEPRTHKFTMTMTEAERAQLDAVATAAHRSAADWIRLTVAEAHRALPKQPTKKPTK